MIVYSFHNAQLLGDYLWELHKEGKMTCRALVFSEPVHGALCASEHCSAPCASPLCTAVSLSVKMWSLPSHCKEYL